MEVSGGVRILAPIDQRSSAASSWRAEDERGSPLVVRFIYLLHWGDYGEKMDARPAAEESLRNLTLLPGCRPPEGIVPWRSVELSKDRTMVAAVRPFLRGRLWDDYANLRKHPTVVPPADLKQAFVRLGRALDALHAAHPDPQPRLKPNNLVSDGRDAWLSDSGLDALLRVSSDADAGPRRTVWDPINWVLGLPGGMKSPFPGDGARRTQAELAAAYFALRTGLPVLYRDARQPIDDPWAVEDEHKKYLASGALRLDPLTNELERECLARALSVDPEARFASCAEFASTLPSFNPPSSPHR